MWPTLRHSLQPAPNTKQHPCGSFFSSEMHKNQMGAEILHMGLAKFVKLCTFAMLQGSLNCTIKLPFILGRHSNALEIGRKSRGSPTRCVKDTVWTGQPAAPHPKRMGTHSPEWSAHKNSWTCSETKLANEKPNCTVNHVGLKALALAPTGHLAPNKHLARKGQ